MGRIWGIVLKKLCNNIHIFSRVKINKLHNLHLEIIFQFL
jgi:hypothetical protein